jgi:hypothetical protein
MSWDESFADRYEEWSAPMTADIAFYVGLARAADGPLVELAIGNGRVAIPVAQATGKPVIAAAPAHLGRPPPGYVFVARHRRLEHTSMNHGLSAFRLERGG